MTVEFLLPSPADTDLLAARLAHGLDRGLLVFLRGPLGAGKTALVRGVLRAKGYAGRVKSPTFTLLEPYTISRVNFYHFDFYRINDPQELEDAGFRECFDEHSTCLVEWPERAGDWLPEPDLTVSMEVLDSGRRAHVTADSHRGAACIREMLCYP